MEYNFVIGNHLFIVHSEFEIVWEEWHYNFIYKDIKESNLSKTEYNVLCFINPPDIEQYKKLYAKGTQHVYEGVEGEIRVHYLINNEITVFCEEKKDSYYIHIDWRFINQAYMYLIAMMLEKVLLEENALILHSSYVEYNKKAILFTGPSGIGKSTQADLWMKYMNAKLINGDRTLLKKYQDGWNACGFPICGTSKIALNRQMPIGAIVYLSQNHQNTVERLYGFEAYKNILSEISANYWKKERLEKTLGLLEGLCSEVPIFHLSCTPKKDAVECLFEEIYKWMY